jgi:hypothetical protein
MGPRPAEKQPNSRVFTDASRLACVLECALLTHSGAEETVPIGRHRSDSMWTAVI